MEFIYAQFLKAIDFIKERKCMTSTDQAHEFQIKLSTFSLTNNQSCPWAAKSYP